MNTYKKQIFIFIFIFYLSGMSAQYPFLTHGVQHSIYGTVGEERPSGDVRRQRYHYGLDFNKPNGTNVYAIEGGIYNRINNSSDLLDRMSIGHFAYLHVVNHPPEFIDGETYVNANTFIGRVTLGHVHLQQSTIDLINITKDQDPANGWINRLNNLTPFVDNVAPRIDFFCMYRHPDLTATTQIQNQLALFGKIDLLLNSEDARIDENGDNLGGSNQGFGNAPKVMSWEILNLDGSIFQAHPGVNFSNVPPSQI